MKHIRGKPCARLSCPGPGVPRGLTLGEGEQQQGGDAGEHGAEQEDGAAPEALGREAHEEAGGPLGAQQRQVRREEVGQVRDQVAGEAVADAGADEPEGQRGQGAASGTPGPGSARPHPRRSRREAEDDSVLPDDPGAADLAHRVEPGSRGPLGQRLQLCRERGNSDRAGSAPPPHSHAWGWGRWPWQCPTHPPGGCPGDSCLRPAPAGSSWPCPAAAWPAASAVTPAAGPGTWARGSGHGAPHGPGRPPALTFPPALK